MNVREPAPLSEEYLDVEKAYLRDETAVKGVTRLTDLVPVSKGLSDAAPDDHKHDYSALNEAS